MIRTITVCICTFRRAHIVDTLRSIDAQVLDDDIRLDIVVADNDVEPSAREMVLACATSLKTPVTYIHAPAANISIARNACLDAAAGDHVALIDDDEIATPNWLHALSAEMRATGAQAVLGPVRATYRSDAPSWLRDGDFHSTYPVTVNGEIITGYTCNALLAIRSPALAGLRFDLALGKSGGEDSTYFSEMHARGGRIAYAPDAWTEEEVPVGREAFSWLMKRRFRMGQTHGQWIARDARGSVAARQFLLAGAKAGACFAMAAATLPLPVRRNRAVLRGTLHVGVMGSFLGVSNLVQYGGIERRNAA